MFTHLTNGTEIRDKLLVDGFAMLLRSGAGTHAFVEFGLAATEWLLKRSLTAS